MTTAIQGHAGYPEPIALVSTHGDRTTAKNAVATSMNRHGHGFSGTNHAGLAHTL